MIPIENVLMPELHPTREEPRKDETYYHTDELDSLLNLICSVGCSKHQLWEWAKKRRRSFVAVLRQWQLFLISDKDTKIFSYEPGPVRTWRGGTRLNHMDMYVIEKHNRYDKEENRTNGCRQVPPERTACILARPVEEILPYK